MAAIATFYRNWTSADIEEVDIRVMPGQVFPTIDDVDGNDWTRSGYSFVQWNTARNGSGTGKNPETALTAGIFYAIWAEDVPDVSISYNGNSIVTMDSSGTEILDTNGKYMADDITIVYIKPSAPPILLEDRTVVPQTYSQTITANTGYDGLGTVTVSAISPTKAAQTYTPTTVNQTIAGGQYLSGTQTILGDANLTAENIKKDVSIFGVTGTYEGSGGGGNPVTFSTSSVIKFLAYIDNNGVYQSAESIRPPDPFSPSYTGVTTENAMVAVQYNSSRAPSFTNLTLKESYNVTGTSFYIGIFQANSAS